MNFRDFRIDDEGKLREIHARAGYGNAFPVNIEDYIVAEDEFCVPLMAAGLRLVPEVTLICAPGGTTHPLVKLKGIALLHEALRDKLAGGNHTEAFSFVAPQVERAFGRHLVKHFGWQETWKSFAIRIEKP